MKSINGLLVAAVAAIAVLSLPIEAQAKKDPNGYAANQAAVNMFLQQQAAASGQAYTPIVGGAYGYNQNAYNPNLYGSNYNSGILGQFSNYIPYGVNSNAYANPYTNYPSAYGNYSAAYANPNGVNNGYYNTSVTPYNGLNTYVNGTAYNPYVNGATYNPYVNGAMYNPYGNNSQYGQPRLSNLRNMLQNLF